MSKLSGRERGPTRGPWLLLKAGFFLRRFLWKFFAENAQSSAPIPAGLWCARTPARTARVGARYADQVRQSSGSGSRESEQRERSHHRRRPRRIVIDVLLIGRLDHARARFAGKAADRNVVQIAAQHLRRLHA